MAYDRRVHFISHSILSNFVLCSLPFLVDCTFYPLTICRAVCVCDVNEDVGLSDLPPIENPIRRVWNASIATPRRMWEKYSAKEWAIGTLAAMDVTVKSSAAKEGTSQNLHYPSGGKKVHEKKCKFNNTPATRLEETPEKVNKRRCSFSISSTSEQNVPSRKFNIIIKYFNSCFSEIVPLFLK